MNFKTLPFLLLSVGMLSGCTNSCQGNKNSPTAADQAEPAGDTTQAPAEQAAPTEQSAPADQTNVDENSATDVAASEQQT